MIHPKPRRASSTAKKTLPFVPWVYFIFFLGANTLISFASLSLVTKFWIGLFGLFLPLLVGFQTLWMERRKQKPASLFFNDLFPLPIWLWILFFGVLIFTRFWRLTTLPFWPMADEGIMGFLSLSLAHHWDWRLLYSEVRLEPMAFWLLALYFKVIKPSFFSFRLFPTLVSFATVFAAYWAARQYFTRSLAFLFVLFSAFSFWELTLVRLCSPLILGPLFEYLCLGLLGLWLKSRDSGSKQWVGAAFVLFSGIGFYIWISWGGIWLGFLAILIAHFFLARKKNIRPLLVFLGTTFLLILPLLTARLSAGGSSYIHKLFSFSVFKSFAYYTTAVFWDGFFSFPYGSNWGGFFNPILGSLVLLGLIYFFREPSRLFLGGFTACLAMASLPALLANGFEIYRILLIFPLLTFLSALGAYGLMAHRPHFLRLMGAVILILGSFSLDANNYVNHYCNIKLIPEDRQWRSVEYYHAYEILDSIDRSDGPSEVFSEFNLDYDDKTLNVICFPYNTLQNKFPPSLSPRWAVLFCNIDYAPFLQKRFHGMKGGLLNPNLPPQDLQRYLAMFLIPTEEIPTQILDRWIQVHEVYRKINLEVKNKNPLISWEEFTKSLATIRDLSKSDPFLASIFWEKTASFQIMSGDFQAAAQSFKMALQEGYPMEHLRYNLELAQQLAQRRSSKSLKGTR